MHVQCSSTVLHTFLFPRYHLGDASFVCGNPLYNSSLVYILIIQHLPSLMSYVLAKQLSEGVYQYRLQKCPRNGDGCVQEGLVG